MREFKGKNLEAAEMAHEPDWTLIEVTVFSVLAYALTFWGLWAYENAIVAGMV